MTFSNTKRRTTTMPAQPKSTTGPRVLTVRELAGYLRVHQSTVYRLLREQKLPAFKVGSDWRFNREEIERWMIDEQKRS
jgi:excisionase family DNA binding protein